MSQAIYDQVSRTIGANRVFMDIESIQIGVNFHEVIATALGQSGVLLAIIGPDWAPSVELGRRSRLFETGDLVRFEISTALLHGLRVVPVLVDDAAMPKEVDLPIDLRVLPRLNAFRVNHASFVKDVQQLLDSIFEVG
jgi:hypothetical protein